MGTIRTSRGAATGNRLVAALAAVLLVGLWVAGPAAAQQLRPYAFEDAFNGAGSSAGTMTGALQDLTIDQSSGRLFALDAHGSDATVTQLTAAGAPVGFTELGGSSSIVIPGGGTVAKALQWDNSPKAGGLYVLAGQLNGYRPGGGLKWGGGDVCAFCSGDDVAVDPNGWVYLTQFNGVAKFDPDTGSEAGGLFDYLYERGAEKLEYDSEGHYLWTDRNQNGLVKTVDQSECTKNQFETICPDILRFNYVHDINLAVEPSNDHVYAIEEGIRVTEYSAAGQPITTFGEPSGGYLGLQGAKGIAVNSTTHDVYVTSTRGGGHIEVFKQQAPVTVPTVTTDPPGHPEETAAVFKGTVNPEDVATTGCKFEWGSTSQYANGTVPCDQGNVFTGSADTAITATVESLSPGATYHY